MPYVTQAELIERFGEGELLQVADRDNDEAIDSDVVAAAIADADAMIDSYCRGLYDVPFDPVPAEVRKASADIARYNLWDDAASEEVERRYRDAVARLKDVSAGRARVNVEAASETQPEIGRIVVGAGASNFDWDGY
ncbi:MAG: DUF1320 domain-containing protein [Gammaproteobacteria bacterium]|nr:DUF1320 domain-containing protein [Gammaproteobacteria bacterium]